MLCWYDDPIFVLSYVDMMILCLIEFKLCWYDDPMLCWYDDPMFFKLCWYDDDMFVLVTMLVGKW